MFISLLFYILFIYLLIVITEEGKCSCWGDPHCRSFDGVFMHFQGDCEYTLAQDGCENGLKKNKPTFVVKQKNWDEYEETYGKDVSWAKEITVEIYGQVNGIKAIPSKRNGLDGP